MHRGAAPSSPLPRQVKLFGWVSLLNDFASEMIYPLLPAFISAVLGPILAWWLLASGTANVRAVIAWSIVPGVIVLMLAAWAVKGGEGRWRAGEANALAQQPSPPSTAFHRSPPPALFAISFFYLLRM